MGITSLWPWPLTQGHRFQKGLSQCDEKPFSENWVKIGSSAGSAGILFTSRAGYVHRQTERQANCSENITRGGVRKSLCNYLLDRSVDSQISYPWHHSWYKHHRTIHNFSQICHNKNDRYKFVHLWFQLGKMMKCLCRQNWERESLLLLLKYNLPCSCFL